MHHIRVYTCAQGILWSSCQCHPTNARVTGDDLRMAATLRSALTMPIDQVITNREGSHMSNQTADATVCINSEKKKRTVASNSLLYFTPSLTRS